MKSILLFLLTFSVLTAVCIQSMAQSGDSQNGKVLTKNKSKMKQKVRFINPPQLAKPPGYTHIVEVSGGQTVYIAGQIALDSSGNVVGRNNFRAQTEQVFANLKMALESVEASFDNVIKLNMYVTDVSQLAALREVRDKYVNLKTPPASTLIEVQKLAREELMIEIEAVAVLPD